jgi:signal peptidase I
MEPTPEPADRILAKKIGVVSSLQRGDRVVFDVAGTVADRAAGAGFEQGSAMGRVLGAITSMVSVNLNESECAKRVVGLTGDHVVCCDGNGLLTVNDIAVQEPFLYPGDKPSDLGFDVAVPPEHVWVMGDHRSDSADSRARLGDPGGGMVRLDDVIGRAVMVSWPPSRARLLHAPGSLRGMQARTAGKGHR